MNNHKLTCNQVCALINFYIEGKLNPALHEFVNIHIQNCPECKKKLKELEDILYSTKSKFAANKSNIELKNNLSAYIDKELEYDDNIKIKKLTISNSVARQELEAMYKYQKLLHSAYEHTKNNLKKDYSKDIIMSIANEDYYMTTYFKKIAILFVIIMLGIITGFAYLYF